MSYDLVVFDPEHAPRDDAAFKRWFDNFRPPIEKRPWLASYNADGTAYVSGLLSAAFQDADAASQGRQCEAGVQPSATVSTQSKQEQTPSSQDVADWLDRNSERMRCHNDDATASQTLRSWLQEMFITFPPMNGPKADHSADAHGTDYEIHEHFVLCAFAGSVAREAFDTVTRLAQKHFVGVWDMNGPVDWPARIRST